MPPDNYKVSEAEKKIGRMTRTESELDMGRFSIITGTTEASHNLPISSRYALADWKYKTAMKMFIPYRSTVKVEGVIPVNKVGFFSFIYLTWITDKLVEFYQKHKKGEMASVWAGGPEESCDHNVPRLKVLWDKEQAEKGEKASFKRAVFRFARTRLCGSVLAIMTNAIVSFLVSSFLIKEITDFLENPESPLYFGIIFVLILAVSHFIRLSSFSLIWCLGFITGTRVRSACLGLVYDKVLRLQNINSKQIGELVNIFVNDALRLYIMCLISPYLFAMPFYLFLGLGYSIFLIREWGLLAAAIFYVSYKLQGLLARHVANLRTKTVILTDERVNKMTEIINSMKLIKMYAWEKPFMDSVMTLRKQEKKLLQDSTTLQSIASGIAPVIPTLASVITIAAYKGTGNNISASMAFAFVGALNFLRIVLNMLPWATRCMTEAIISLRRMQRILLLEEYEPDFSVPVDSRNVLEIRNASFEWVEVKHFDQEVTKSKNRCRKKRTPEESNTAVWKPITSISLNTVDLDILQQKANVIRSSSVAAIPEKKQKQQEENQEASTAKTNTLHDISFMAESGKLIGVCGPVGCGKSSLLSAILGRIKRTKGTLALKGEVAIASQQAWLFNGTLKDNILFGSEMDKEKYKAVIHACGLETDLELLVQGDETEIGDRGMNLSGGQKQRVSVARAVYSEREIYLLDDPLSAVDVHVGRHIFNECFKKLMKGKTLVLTTHQLQFLKDCDHILVMDQGRIVESGTHEEILGMNGYYKRMIETFYANLLTTKQNERPTTDVPESQNEITNEKPQLATQISNLSSSSSYKDEDKVVSDGTITEAEHVAFGSISPAVYRRYLKAGGGYIVCFLVLLCYIIAFAITVFGNWWLSYWINQTNNTTESLSNDSRISHSRYAVEQSEYISNSSSSSYSSTLLPDSTIPNATATLITNITTSVNAVISWSTTLVPLLTTVSHLASTITTSVMTTMNSSLVSSTSITNSTTSGNMSTDQLSENEDNIYLLVYSAIAIFIPIMFSLKGISFAKFTMTASTNMHDKVLQGVMKTPMSFFDANPAGRILNRFSRDLDEADVNLPQLLDMALQISTQSILVILMSIQVEPWLVLAFIPALAGVGLLRHFSIRAVRQLKRIENQKRSPLLSHVNTTANGLVTISTFNRQDYFRERFRYHNDMNASVNFVFDASLRWVGVRVDMLFTCVSIAAALVFVCTRGAVAPSFAAMSMGFINLILNVAQFFIRMVNDTEARFTSIERLNEYLSLPPEVTDKSNVQPTHIGWPVSGDIQFSDVWMRYRDNMNPVLKHVSLHIFDKQKVGIVGRTGAGKSSLGSVLFRLVELYKGHIFIDQVDIATINLETLRSNISIIPQDPVLFTGTMRYNLDPFSKYTDDELWQSLSKVHMKNKILNVEAGLEFMVEQNGDNLSVGERQLVCMARAILRNNKVLLLDEATASIDTETDAMIQSTIQTAFAECTVLTIAHRLNTVLHCDKILVMDKGKVIEFASPDVLLHDQESTFFKMLQSGEH